MKVKVDGVMADGVSEVGIGSRKAEGDDALSYCVALYRAGWRSKLDSAFREWVPLY